MGDSAGNGPHPFLDELAPTARPALPVDGSGIRVEARTAAQRPDPGPTVQGPWELAHPRLAAALGRLVQLLDRLDATLAPRGGRPGPGAP